MRKKKRSEETTPQALPPGDDEAAVAPVKQKKKSKVPDPVDVQATGLQLDLGTTHKDDDATLKVATKFAEKYNARKDKQELARAKREGLALSDSDTDSEDETASLLTTNVENKIFETLHKIRTKDKSIYDRSQVFFSDADFKEAPAKEEGKTKSVKYKDFLRDTLLNEGAEAFEREDEELEEKIRKGKATPKEEQQHLKAAMVAAAHGDDDEEDDLFSVREKSAEEKRDEAESFKDFLSNQTGERNEDGEAVMSKYWKADEDLDQNEIFLRDFILQKGWLETTSLQAARPDRVEIGGKNLDVSDNGSDSEDREEKDLDEADKFESDYNFRFEHADGAQIQGHARFQESSVRQRDDKRKRKRKEKDERKDADKVRRTEELKRLKNMKKLEIARRLEKIREITGNDEGVLGRVDLEADFDPEHHDEQMGTLLGNDFDEREDALDEDELEQAPDGFDDLDVSKAKSSAPPAWKTATAAAEGEQADNDWEDDAQGAGGEDEGEEGDELWFMCDECQKPIPGGKKRFDCTVCENYTLCAGCFRVRRHPHKFVRLRVPERCVPPDNLPAREPGPAEEDQNWEEYFQLDYEDIIGGDLPTRFKYRKVEPDSYGLTPVQILEMSDQELNRIKPLKQLRPYRGEAGNPDDKQQERWKQRGAPGGDKKQRYTPRNGAAKRNADQAAKRGLSTNRLDAYNLQAETGGRGGGKNREGHHKKKKKPDAAD